MRRRPIDMDAYVRSAQSDGCFICDIVAGRPGHRHHVVYEDEGAIAFLNRFPVLLGYTIVAPRRHREQVTGDFGEEDYLALQRVVRRVGEALRRVVPMERLYVLSLGSQQGNRHVHWHLAPLPPGVPYEEQQLAALALARGVLDLTEAELSSLAERLRRELDAA